MLPLGWLPEVSHLDNWANWELILKKDYWGDHWIKRELQTHNRFSSVCLSCLRSLPLPYYSTDINEINVTIAESVCDVQSANSTHIICVTSAQGQSQETKVRVSIGNQGIAKMVRLICLCLVKLRCFKGRKQCCLTDFIVSDYIFSSSVFLLFFRTTQISFTLTCGRPSSRGEVCLHQRRAHSLLLLKARPSCWTPTHLCSKCCLFKVQILLLMQCLWKCKIWRTVAE